MIYVQNQSSFETACNLQLLQITILSLYLQWVKMTDLEGDMSNQGRVCPGCFSVSASLWKPNWIVELFCNYNNKQLYWNVIALTENILMRGFLFCLVFGKVSIALSHLFWIFKRSSYSTDILLHIEVLVILFCSCILVCLFTLVYLNREGGNLEWVGRVHRFEGKVPVMFWNSWPLLFFFKYYFYFIDLL